MKLNFIYFVIRLKLVQQKVHAVERPQVTTLLSHSDGLSVINKLYKLVTLYLPLESSLVTEAGLGESSLSMILSLLLAYTSYILARQVRVNCPVDGGAILYLGT